MYLVLKILNSLLRLKQISKSKFYFNKYVKLKKNFLYLAKSHHNKLTTERASIKLKQRSVVCD